MGKLWLMRKMLLRGGHMVFSIERISTKTSTWTVVCLLGTKERPGSVEPGRSAQRYQGEDSRDTSVHCSGQGYHLEAFNVASPSPILDLANRASTREVNGPLQPRSGNLLLQSVRHEKSFGSAIASSSTVPPRRLPFLTVVLWGFSTMSPPSAPMAPWLLPEAGVNASPNRRWELCFLKPRLH